MGELKSFIVEQSRKITEKYFRWEQESIAPMSSPKEDTLPTGSTISKGPPETVQEALSPNSNSFDKDPRFRRTVTGEEVRARGKELAAQADKAYVAKAMNLTNPGAADKYLDEVGVIEAHKKILKDQVEKSKEKIRRDFQGYSKIKIDRINGNNEYTDIQLINADRFQKCSEPTKWSVLTLYTGNGTGEQAIGVMVRKRPTEDSKVMNTSKDSIEVG